MQRAITEKLDAIPITDLFEYYHVPWQEGRNFRCPFPNHMATGATPSFRYYKDTNSASCFGCHHGGGPIQFVMNMENISYTAACDKLIKLYGIKTPEKFTYQKLVDRQKAKEEKWDNNHKFGILGELLAQVEDTASMVKFSMLYLMQSQYSGMEFISIALDLWHLPLEKFMQQVPQNIKENQKTAITIIKSLVRHPFEQLRGFDPYRLKSGFFNEEQSGITWPTQQNRYVFPIFLPGSIIAGFSGRTQNPNETLKYQTELAFGLSKKELLYGLDIALPEIKKLGYVIIVEGILDAARCHSLGHLNTVAPCCAYVSEELYFLLSGLTKNFILLQDNDYGGDCEAEMSAKVISDHKGKSMRLLVPSGLDPDTYGQRCPIAFKDQLEKTKSWF